MKNLVITTGTIPAPVTISNFDELKAGLTTYVKKFELVDYEVEGYDAAKKDAAELKEMRDTLSAKKKELESPVAVPLKQIRELDDILKNYHTIAKNYITKAADKAGVRFDMPFLDTYFLAKNFKDDQRWDTVKLDYLAEQYSFKHEAVHRAWSDAKVNAQLYFELQKLSGK